MITKLNNLIRQYENLQNESINESIEFINRYNAFSKSTIDDRIKDYIDRYSNLFQGYLETKNEYQKYNEDKAEDFNVFDILKINTKEVILHSPLIAFLLDPNEKHGQGDLFYKLFLETVFESEKKEYNKFINEKSNDYLIHTENKKVDISIRSTNHNNPFALIFENKINAPDQNEQILRYYVLYKKIGYNDKNLKFFYLTKEGKRPEKYSISTKERKRLEDKKVLIIISYKKHIIDWLEKAKEISKAPIITYLIHQYILTIKNLTNE